ncbi:hypothetical protein [Sphingomonas sp. UBA978]|uniref:hypothetical protein n=1 Tax=unclassified Sphingomonas TaxID=196159 RepID=UPI0032E52868
MTATAIAGGTSSATTGVIAAITTGGTTAGVITAEIVISGVAPNGATITVCGSAANFTDGARRARSIGIADVSAGWRRLTPSDPFRAQ